MRRKPRWYKVPADKANEMSKAGYPVKQTENGQFWVLCAGSELWAFVVKGS